MNVNYREVKRKAAVGERIKIVKPELAIGYGVGDEGVVVEVSGDSGAFAELPVGRRGLFHREYIVLDPINDATSPQEPDALTAAFRQFILANADAIRAILPELESGITASGLAVDSAGSVKATGVSVSKPDVPRKLTRAQVIAKATADVTELLRIGKSTFADLPKVSPLHGRFYTAEFHVNRDKRVVTALVKRGNAVYAKFTAKCSPADVFHAEIGKAIALRKALGLTVPGEYMDAPQPEKAYDYAKVTYANKRYTITPGSIKEGTHGTDEAAPGSPVAREGKIIDDTDVDYGELIAAGGAGNHSLRPKGVA
jgi:hypothetical protein